MKSLRAVVCGRIDPTATIAKGAVGSVASSMVFGDNQPTTLAAVSASVAISGTVPSLSTSSSLQPASASASFAGQVPTVSTASAATNLQVGWGGANMYGQAPSVTRGVILDIPDSTTNNSQANAVEVAPNVDKVRSSFLVTKEYDFYKVYLEANQKLDVAMTGPAGTDWDLYIENQPTGSTGTFSSTVGTTSENVSCTAGSTPGFLYLKVFSYGAPMPSEKYTLALTYTPPNVAGGLRPVAGTMAIETGWNVERITANADGTREYTSHSNLRGTLVANDVARVDFPVQYDQNNFPTTNLRFPTKAGQKFTVWAEDGKSDWAILLKDRTNNAVASASDAFATKSPLSYTADADGECTVRVDLSLGSDGKYVGLRVAYDPPNVSQSGGTTLQVPSAPMVSSSLPGSVNSTIPQQPAAANTASSLVTLSRGLAVAASVAATLSTFAPDLSFSRSATPASITATTQLTSLSRSIAQTTCAVSSAGLAPTLSTGSVLQATAAGFAISGTVPGIVRNASIQATQGAMAVNAGPPALSYVYKLAATPGTVSTSSGAASISRVVAITATQGASAISGLVPSIVRADALRPSAASVAMVGLVPSISTDASLVPGPGSANTSSVAPSLSISLRPSSGAAASASASPALNATLNTPGPGLATASAQAASVSRSLLATASSATFSTYSPAITRSITPTCGAVVVSANAPSTNSAIKVPSSVATFFASVPAWEVGLLPGPGFVANACPAPTLTVDAISIDWSKARCDIAEVPARRYEIAARARNCLQDGYTSARAHVMSVPSRVLTVTASRRHTHEAV